MARISDELINQIKQQVDLVRLVESQGYKLKSHGVKDKALSCPFHEDKTESCVITPSKNLFNCFGCGESGSVIDWVMKTQGVSFRHAVEILQKDTSSLAASGSEQTNKAVKYGTTQKLATPLATDADLQATLQQVIGYYHETLKQSPEALDYLKQRGLDHPELIDTFQLGYANRTLGYRLPQKNRQAGAEIRGKLQQIGILRKSGHEHFNGSIVIPVCDEHGHVHEVYGRKLLDNLRKGTPKHTYLPGAHGGVWNASSLAASDEVILCESLIDAMTFWCAGFRNVTASYGTNGFTDDHLKVFKQHQIKRVLIAYDRDDAGHKAAEKLAEMLMSEGFDVFRILFPKNMDANEYARQVKPAQKSLGLAIRKAEWLGNGKAPVISTTEKQPVVDVETGEILSPDVPSESTTSLVASVPTEAAAIPEQAIPQQTVSDEATQQNDNELIVTLDNRRYRIRGLDKNQSYEQLKVNLLVSLDDRFHVDNLDIYSARARHLYIKQASMELCVPEDEVKKDLGRLLLQLESLQDKKLQEKYEQPNNQASLNEAERRAALGLLNDPSLLSRVLTDFEACGVIGEESNKLVGYLAAVSRKLDKPLAVMIQSSSAAGKSSLMDAVLNMIPTEERIQFSAMTGQSLFYMGETNLKNKILAISEEEGADQASYALKLLQSEGEVSIASTGKNPVTGNLETQQYKVEGPVMLMMTTTAIDIDEELMNRCLVLSVNETREQTEAIHQMQRKRQTLEGLLAEHSKKDLITLHQNAQRLLRPLLVANPYAEQLTFLSDKTRTRRDHMKYLTLIRAIALLHQYQRDVKRVEHNGQLLEYIEVTQDDIKVANQLAHEVLGRTLDELPPQTRKLLQLTHTMVTDACKAGNIKQSDYRFTRKDVRNYSGWGNTQLKVHLKRLEEMEYLLIHRGSRGQSFIYELLYSGEGESGDRFLQGLLDLESGYDDNKSGLSAQQSGAGHTQVGTGSEGGHMPESQTEQHMASLLIEDEGKNNTRPNGQIMSYSHSLVASV
ncbi:CHC2 zinc finger domain-containing protein [Pseudoalteromonas aurantia]|uniref:DNA primase n=2 Tax=Pseudoalteromonas TaxID=53246 RepID=A0A5S3V3X2_9GAMM|nr:CHC2 zinc finger domain-containing protein [Pseudoalteromonas aurantia]TMO64849.1 DNA primase [Pseudoalteromonas aurantia]